MLDKTKEVGRHRRPHPATGTRGQRRSRATQSQASKAGASTEGEKQTPRWRPPRTAEFRSSQVKPSAGQTDNLVYTFVKRLEVVLINRTLTQRVSSAIAIHKEEGIRELGVATSARRIAVMDDDFQREIDAE